MSLSWGEEPNMGKRNCSLSEGIIWGYFQGKMALLRFTLFFNVHVLFKFTACADTAQGFRLGFLLLF